MKHYYYKNKKYFQQRYQQDSYFSTFLLNKIINILFIDGKKIVVKKHFISFIKKYKHEFSRSFLYFFFKIFKKLNIYFYLKNKKIASKVFNFPVPIQRTFQYRKILKFFFEGLLDKEYKTDNLQKKLQNEFFNVLLYDKGIVIKKYQTYLTAILDNRGYGHYRWH